MALIGPHMKAEGYSQEGKRLPLSKLAILAPENLGKILGTKEERARKRSRPRNERPRGKKLHSARRRPRR